MPLVCKRLEDNHAGWKRVIMEVHTISLLYFKQADTTKQPTAIQTVTMQPMWCNPNINTYLFSPSLHSRPFPSLIPRPLSRLTLSSTRYTPFRNTSEPRDEEPSVTGRECDVWRKWGESVCTKVGRKFMQLEYGNECRCAPSHSFFLKQAVTTKQPASMQIVSSCDNATHVVQPKHTH